MLETALVVVAALLWLRAWETLQQVKQHFDADTTLSDYLAAFVIRRPAPGLDEEGMVLMRRYQRLLLQAVIVALLAVFVGLSNLL